MSVTTHAVKPLSPEPRYRAYTTRHLEELTTRAGLSADERLAVQAVAQVLPFRANSYVVDELIDWAAAPDDPMYRLLFPQPDMLPAEDVARIADLLRAGASAQALNAVVQPLRARLNPHPAGQMDLNVPRLANAEPLPGLQHKYAETVLFFPQQGQTCHAYCTYCFRWAQFVGDADLKFASRDIASLVDYVRSHEEVTNVLLTGGDPMVMNERVLARYIEPLLDIEHLEAIRIGTKSLAWWPQRFVSDPDADDTLRLFERVVAAGKNLALMAHFSHPNELASPMVLEAVRRIRATGAVIRTQAPLIRGINDDAATWERMWRTHLRHGMVPYYMFVERDTGPRDYFAVPLARAVDIFRSAYQRVSGLGRTVRGPSMSATPGKVCVDGVADIGGEKVFVLHFIQARNPEWVGRPFFAKYDEQATWLFDLRPALGADAFPWETASTSGAHNDLPVD
ncbi:lysine 2,3-aminomutase [Myxococcus sp. K15C18031901]|uniref:KamA family radical SAM protein n=1 Tax=Myxococcus dinghuensis TaxID=2906761 RepID=UPI0020A71B22|nr:lysine 2,3-aminomutase [Myxococcus dinghuensis]MCP3102642.1 lysine 2,3-aminomutase [Myxococcus dinghuensis]